MILAMGTCAIGFAGVVSDCVREIQGLWWARYGIASISAGECVCCTSVLFGRGVDFDVWNGYFFFGPARGEPMSFPLNLTARARSSLARICGLGMAFPDS